jgi:predicted nucleic acid-binding protein
VILVDSNILIDVMDRDPSWYEWSIDKMTESSKAGRVVINHIIVAEVAPYAEKLEDFLSAIEPMCVEVEPLCNRTAFTAGTAFRSYRKRRDSFAPKSMLPDFLIGGHAHTLGAAILTRDPRFYRAYFPSVPLITPLKDQND